MLNQLVAQMHLYLEFSSCVELSLYLCQHCHQACVLSFVCKVPVLYCEAAARQYAASGNPMQPHHQPNSGPMGPPGHIGGNMTPPFIPPGMPMGPPPGPPRSSGTDLDALLSKQTVQGRARTER